LGDVVWTWYGNTTPPSQPNSPPNWKEIPVDASLAWCKAGASNAGDTVMAPPTDIDKFAEELWVDDPAGDWKIDRASIEEAANGDPTHFTDILKIHSSGAVASQPEFTAFDDSADAEARTEPSGNEILDGTPMTGHVSWLRGIEGKEEAGGGESAAPTDWINQARNTSTYALKGTTNTVKFTGDYSGPFDFILGLACVIPKDAAPGTEALMLCKRASSRLCRKTAVQLALILCCCAESIHTHKGGLNAAS